MKWTIGDEIAGVDAVYPCPVYTVEDFRDGGHWVVYPSGGGFQIRIPQWDAGHWRKFDAAERKMQRGTFGFDWHEDGEGWPGMSDGSLWNGWEEPYFTLEIIREIIAELFPEEHRKETPEGLWYFDEGFEEWIAVGTCEIGGQLLYSLDGFCFIRP